MALRVSRQVAEVLVEGQGALRVSRQVAEALVEGDGTLRVSRQHVEVLVPNILTEIDVETTLSMGQTVTSEKLFNKSASSVISIGQSVDRQASLNPSVISALVISSTPTYVGPRTVSAFSQIQLEQGARIPLTFEVEATSEIEFGTTVDASGTRRVSAESVITLQQFADDFTKLRHYTDTLDLTHAVNVDRITPASSHIDLDQDARAATLIRQASTTIDLQQTIRLQPFQQDTFGEIELSQAVRSNLHSGVSLDALDLSQSVEVAKPIRVSVESEITYTESVWDEDLFDFVDVDAGLRHSVDLQTIGIHDYGSILGVKQGVSYYLVKATAIAASATSVITLTQDAHKGFAEEITTQLGLSQSTVGLVHDPVYSSVELAQTVIHTVTRATRPTTSALDINQTATYTLIIASTKSQYSPFVGSSTDPNAPTPPSAAIDGPMAGIEVPFQLVYPSIGDVTDAVSLKAPNLGNLDRLSFNSIQRETRGGTLIVYADPDWPKIQTLVLSFSGLLNVEAQALLTFMDDYLGQEIGLIDWEHRYWRGVIVTPDEPIVEDRFDSFTASFSFEGELDPLWNPQVVPPSLRYSATRSEQQDGYYVPNDPILPLFPGTTAYYTAEAGAAIKVGNPLYLTGGGLVNPAQANAAGTTQVAGVSIDNVASGISCRYLSEGQVEQSDWTLITGSVNLSAGATYFLDPTTVGRITTTAPTTAGQYVVRVGRAVNTTTLDIEIELPILL